jgi:hypothetical protein
MTKGTTHTTNQNPTTEPASRNNNVQGTKVSGLTKVAKHPPEQPTTAAKHPPEANFNQHDGGGKASARLEQRQSIRQQRELTTKRDPDDADEMRRRQAQKKEKLSQESRRPPPAQLSRQRL